MRRIVLPGLVTLLVILGGALVPATAATDPASTALRPASTALRPASAGRPASVGLQQASVPKISCVSTSDCLAVKGTSSQSVGGTSAIATGVARWNGTGWKRLPVALPKGTRSADLYGVSCRAANACLVVGDYYTSASPGAASHPLALAYNGTSLKPTAAVPLPKSTSQASLGGVSCTTARHCVAIGTASGSPGAFGAAGLVSVIENWNGARWTLHAAGSPARTLVQLAGISCVTSAYCVLAGEAYSQAGPGRLYLRAWNGSKLTVMRPAAVGGTSQLLFADVSCATRASCAVSGGVLSNSSGAITAFTEVWNGKAWRAVTAAWPKGTAGSYLMSVSCTGAQACEAVGEAGPDEAPGAAAAAYNGTSWVPQAVPAPPKGRASALSGVSCLSAARCVAVGATGPATGNPKAIITGFWNGTTWKLSPGF